MKFFMMLCRISLCLLQRMQDFTFYVNKSMFFHNLLFEFSRQFFMMLCGKSLHLLQRMQDFTFYVNKSMFFHNLLLNFCENRLTFRFSWKMFKHWLTSSLLISLEKIWFRSSSSISWGCQRCCSECKQPLF
jgi:hypothetical protein